MAKAAHSKTAKVKSPPNGFLVFVIGVACAVAAIRWIMTF